jgi:lipopolysaccharide export system permease protein
MSTMLKIIHKATLKELAATFLITIAFLNSILMMEKLIRLSRVLSGVGATVIDMAKIILYLQPQLLILTIPMGMLLSTLLVYGRMNHDSEIIILRASGMNFLRISSPVFILGAFCFLTGIAVSFYLGPKSSSKVRDTITTIITTRSALALEEGTFNSSFKDIVIIVKGKKSPDTLEDIFIYDNRQKDQSKVLMAKQGRFVPQEGSSIMLVLSNGYINIMGGKTTTELFFERYNMVLSLDASESSTPRKMEYTPSELLTKAKDADAHKVKAGLFLELYRRFSLPAVCIFLAFLGPPLALIAGKSGKLGGLALGLFVFTVYYVLLMYGENLVIAGKLPHYSGAWLSTILLGIFSVAMFRKASLQ